MKSKFYVVNAKRWFDKVNGNTYHSVRVYENGKLLGENLFEYGYESAYMQTALDILHKVGIATKFNVMWHFADSIGREKVLAICNDVTRKRDLKN
jgi:hypothetical protein